MMIIICNARFCYAFIYASLEKQKCCSAHIHQNELRILPDRQSFWASNSVDPVIKFPKLSKLFEKRSLIAFLYRTFYWSAKVHLYTNVDAVLQCTTVLLAAWKFLPRKYRCTFQHNLHLTVILVCIWANQWIKLCYNYFYAQMFRVWEWLKMSSLCRVYTRIDSSFIISPINFMFL